MSNIGQKIKERRIKVGLTADQLAKKLKKSRATIYRYESSEAENMPINILEPLAKELGTTPAELMGWNVPLPKVTHHTSFDSNSPENKLFQAYIRRPELVKNEIISRLEKMDSTFSNNVSKLLQQSGDVNGFMQQTGLNFATVGEFMQGKPVPTSPNQAERIATYFHEDIVRMFFDDMTAPPVMTKKSSSESTQNNPSVPEEEEPDTPSGEALRPYLEDIFKKQVSTNGREERCYQLCKDKELDKFIHEAIDTLDTGDIDFYKVYQKIALMLACDPNEFMRYHVHHKNKEYGFNSFVDELKRRIRSF